MVFDILEVVMNFRHIDLIMDKIPGLDIFDVIDTCTITGGGVFEGRVRNDTNFELNSLIESHVVSVVGVKQTISEGTIRANSE